MNFCDYCKNEFNNKSNLTKHQKTSKYCLKIQEQSKIKTEKIIFSCEFCNKIISSKQMLNYHLKICKTKKKEHKDEMKEMMEKVLQLTKEVERMKKKPYTNNITITDNSNTQDKEEHQIKTNKSELVECSNPNNEEKSDIHEYKFGNNFIVPIRSDGMINATALCKAAEKQLDDYKENLQTKEYLDELSLITGIHVTNLFQDNIGRHSGTWVHRKVGYHLAQWISSAFGLKVSLILDELFISDLKTKLDTNTYQYQKLLTKHNSSLKTHRYIKFKKTDPCFYIIDSGVDCDCLCYKFGITGLDQGNNIDDRLRCHRTLWPKLKVRYLLFIKDVEMIEKNFKMMFEKEINPNGHEIIEGVTFDEMIGRIEKLFDILCIKEYHIMTEEKLKEYNDYVETTIKAI
jgi:hypothetical protein